MGTRQVQWGFMASALMGLLACGSGGATADAWKPDTPDRGVILDAAPGLDIHDVGFPVDDFRPDIPDAPEEAREPDAPDLGHEWDATPKLDIKDTSSNADDILPDIPDASEEAVVVEADAQALDTPNEVESGCTGATDCDDQDPCTEDFCGDGGKCGHKERWACTCTGGGSCCDDFGCPCGIYVCNGWAYECQMRPEADDQDLCTFEICDFATGEILHVPVTCDDSNPCTDDTCFPALGCVYAANVVLCDDGNPCTDDACLPNMDCAYAANEAPCDDGDPCTVGDACNATACQPGLAPLDCDDGMDCTVDVCRSPDGCVHNVAAGYCAITGTCFVEGESHPTDSCSVCSPRTDPNDWTFRMAEYCRKYVDCDDNRPCTTDSCDPCTGDCIHNDRLDCCASDLDCDDGVHCTTEYCSTEGRCVYEVIPDCDPCKVSYVDPSTCTCKTKSRCDDGNMKTTDLCNRWGHCTHKAACGFSGGDAACSDGDPCTEECHHLDCSCSFWMRDCDDQDPCTADSCDATKSEAAACVHVPIECPPPCEDVTCTSA